MNNAVHLVAAIAIFAGAPNGVPAAYADTIALKEDLKGPQEVPATTSPASGKAEATFDTDTKLLTWTVTYTDLTGPALGAHFHGPSDAGKKPELALPANPCKAQSRERQLSQRTRRPTFLRENGMQTFIPRLIPEANFAAK